MVPSGRSWDGPPSAEDAASDFMLCGLHYNVEKIVEAADPNPPITLRMRRRAVTQSHFSRRRTGCSLGADAQSAPIEGACLTKQQRDEVVREIRDPIRFVVITGRGLLFLTNNSQRTRRDVATRLRRLGIEVDSEHVYTCATATARFLAQQKPKGTAFVIGEGGHKIVDSIADLDPVKLIRE
jgi:Haloacid dehalogenase-like hydrolase